MEGSCCGSKVLLRKRRDLLHHSEKKLAALELQEDQDLLDFVAAITQLEINYGYKIAIEDKVDFLVSAARSQFGSAICQAIHSLNTGDKGVTMKGLIEKLHNKWRISGAEDRWNKRGVTPKCWTSQTTRNCNFTR